MHTQTIDPSFLQSSVIAVPPLARDANYKIERSQNQRIIKHLESGGVRSILYGGNAVFYHIAPSEYAQLLEQLAADAGADTWILPSVGPSYGLMMDQAAVLRDMAFPTAMILPQMNIATADGTATAVRKFTDAFGRPAVLYAKDDHYLPVELIDALMKDGCLSAIKYAVVRDNPSHDDYLREMVDRVGPERIVSGIGEQPAIVHLRDFGLSGFTSGCVCVAPALSMSMLNALKNQDFEKAESIRRTFKALEDHRDNIQPIRVLHEAVRLAGIADTGPILPLLSPISREQMREVEAAVKELMGAT